MLALFTVGRWGLSLGGAEYSKAHQVFSLVTLALIASAHHAAFTRAYSGYSLKQAIVLGMMIGVTTQLVIFFSTALSYGLGIQTFFNSPTALNAKEAVPFGTAMMGRTFGLVVNTITNAIAAAIGYWMGAALPRSAKA
jgi:hypothetical protein